MNNMQLTTWNKSQHWICKCSDLDEMSKVNSIFHGRKSLGADRLHPKVIKRDGRKLVKVLYTTIKDAWENLEAPADWLLSSRRETDKIAENLSRCLFSPYQGKCLPV